MAVEIRKISDMRIKYLVGALLAFGCAVVAGAQPIRQDIPLKDGTTLEQVRITGIEHDRFIVIFGGGAKTVLRASISDDFAKTIDWPEAPAPKTPPPKTAAASAPLPPKRDSGLVHNEKFGTWESPNQPLPPPAPPRLQVPTEKEDISPFNPPAEKVERTLLKKQLRGQCFVVTKGGTNYKLCEVKIRLFPKSEYDHYQGEAAIRSTKFVDAWEPYQKAASDRSDYKTSLDVLERMINYRESSNTRMPMGNLILSTMFLSLS
jgi:hypothetical protein